MTTPGRSGSTIIPGLRYRDAHAAIPWLCKAFGFEKHAVYDDDDGGVAHAQLIHGSGMLMLGSARDNAFGHLIKQPDQLDGFETQSPYVVVKDCKAHYEQAKANGAVIVDEYAEKDYGGAGYTCRDLEGHLWSFGSYDPWAEHGG